MVGPHCVDIRAGPGVAPAAADLGVDQADVAKTSAGLHEGGDVYHRLSAKGAADFGPDLAIGAEGNVAGLRQGTDFNHPHVRPVAIAKPVLEFEDQLPALSQRDVRLEVPILIFAVG